MRFDERIGRRMKLQDLHVLMTVLQAGSMGKAAQRLYTSQPAISRTIAELERALGVRLLDRHRHGIEPTVYGRAFLHCGTAVFDDLRLGIKNIEHLANSKVGEVRIGTNPSLAATFVSTVIDRLSRRHPGIVFHLVSEDLQALHKELTARNIDIVIGQRTSLYSEEQFVFERLYDRSYIVMAGVKHPLVRRRRVTLAELMNESWVLPSAESAFGAAVISAFRVCGLEYPRGTVFAAQSDARMSLLHSGRFISIFTNYTLRFPIKRPELKVLPVELPIPPQPVGIVTLKGRSVSPINQLFIDCAREVAKPLASGK